MKIYRNRVSAIVISNEKILGFHAEDPFSHRKYFFLPGGECEPGESKEQTAIRETREETGYEIRVTDAKPLKLRYDFEWNGKLYDTDTAFICGTLLNEIPHPVNDATYHRGVDWLPIKNLDQIFSYNSYILGAVKQLCFP